MGLPPAVNEAEPDAVLHVDDEAIAALLQGTGEVVAPTLRRRKRPREDDSLNDEEEATHPSVATRVLAIYERYGDTGRSTPLARRRRHSKAGQFNTRRLRSFESFVLKAGGSGLSATDVTGLWELFFEWESDSSFPARTPKRLRDYFATPHALRQALADDIDEAVDRDGWYTCNLTELGETSEGYFRSALPVIHDVLKCSRKVRYWAKGSEDEGSSDCRETPFDGDAFRLCEEQVLRDHGPKAFVLGLHAYSDSCVISKSGGTCPTSFCNS